MVRYLRPIGPEIPEVLADPTPKEIVEELDRFVVGQEAAKRSVAIALRNRARRAHVGAEIADEIQPKNILMVGPTGVGKTEIARRLARFSGSPFVKVEASKFTEVGYVGRDVEAMVRELVEVAVEVLREELLEDVQPQAEINAEERLLDLLLPPPGPLSASLGFDGPTPVGAGSPEPANPDAASEAAAEGEESDEDPSESGRNAEDARRALRTREKLRARLRRGELSERIVEVEIREPQAPFLEALSGPVEEFDVNAGEMLRSMFGPRYRKTEMVVPQALDYLIHEEEERLVDLRQVSRLALERAEGHGIIFIDELDKVTSAGDMTGPEVSRQGVQRDLLPILDGSTVTTRYGSIRTDHILFIGAGAFLDRRPSDLIPELQGRFPIRTDLHPLGVDDFEKILTEPEGALLKQYAALLETEGVRIGFEGEGIREMAEVAAQMNERMEDIGARRLHTILERVLEDLLFDAPDVEEREWNIDADYVRKRLSDALEEEDLSRFIL